MCMDRESNAKFKHHLLKRQTCPKYFPLYTIQLFSETILISI